MTLAVHTMWSELHALSLCRCAVLWNSGLLILSEGRKCHGNECRGGATNVPNCPKQSKRPKTAIQSIGWKWQHLCTFGADVAVFTTLGVLTGVVLNMSEPKQDADKKSADVAVFVTLGSITWAVPDV